MRPTVDLPWLPADEQRLAELWADPVMSAAKIGQRMGRTKNSVVAKAQRLGLEGRVSPIRPRVAPVVELSEAQHARRLAGAEPLPAGHPIALAVLAQAGVRFARGDF